MKNRVLSFLITVILICGISFVPANAAETDAKEKEYKKLGCLLSGLERPYSTGVGIPYGMVLPSDYGEIWENAENVYYDKNATYDDYHQAVEEVLDLIFNRQFINYDYAYQTYQNALEETNENHWYSDEEWSAFQNALSGLKTALDAVAADESFSPIIKNEDKLQALTDAFHALLKAYNIMTNRDALVGDIDGNGIVDISDATLLQRYLAEQVELNGAQKMRAAVCSRHCDDLGLDDVTQLQRYLAEYSETPLLNARGNAVLVSEIKTNPLITEDFLMERMFNFNICPRNDLILYDIENGYYSTKDFVEWIDLCEDLSVFE